MAQTTSRFFDEMARLMNDAAGVAQGVRREAETLFKAQAERILREHEVPPLEPAQERELDRIMAAAERDHARKRPGAAGD